MQKKIVVIGLVSLVAGILFALTNVFLTHMQPISFKCVLYWAAMVMVLNYALGLQSKLKYILLVAASTTVGEGIMYIILHYQDVVLRPILSS